MLEGGTWVKQQDEAFLRRRAEDNIRAEGAINNNKDISKYSKVLLYVYLKLYIHIV